MFLAIKSFRDLGVSLQSLRRVRDKLIAEFNYQHPFSSKDLLRTDGKQIFLQEIESEPLNVLSGQYQLGDIIESSLKDVDYDLSPVRWWVDGRNSSILVDPKVSFGAPIDSESGVPVSVIYEALNAYDGSAEDVSADYNVSVTNVRKAHQFYQNRYA